MDKLVPWPTSHFSSQNTTSTSQESQTKSRAGEKILSLPCFPWPGRLILSFGNSMELKGKKESEGFIASLLQEEKIHWNFLKKIILHG